MYHENENKWVKMSFFSLTPFFLKEYALFTQFNVDNYGRPLRSIGFVYGRPLYTIHGHVECPWTIKDCVKSFNQF